MIQEKLVYPSVADVVQFEINYAKIDPEVRAEFEKRITKKQRALYLVQALSRANRRPSREEEAAMADVSERTIRNRA